MAACLLSGLLGFRQQELDHYEHKLRVSLRARTADGGLRVTAFATVQVHSRPKLIVDSFRISERLLAGIE
jgi:hypothetical protein